MLRHTVVITARYALLLMLAACQQQRPMPATHVTPSAIAPFGVAVPGQPTPAGLAALGQALFFEKGLSASGRMSCATCHDPAHAYGPANDLAVQLGGIDGLQQGLRAAPSLRYQQDTPPFSEHFSDTDGDDSSDQGPTGGRGWDGRVPSAHEQAALPLLSPLEMANSDSAAVIARLQGSSSAAQFRTVFGEHAFDDRQLAWNGLLLALEVFQQSPADFYPYSSKYDAFLRHQANLSARERRGLQLFNDPLKGNCAQCHPSTIKRGAFPQFTDRGLVALGVPRNPRIAANRDPGFRDLGLCGPLRTDMASHQEYCGLFKTPTLRNVARRHSFFHNGVYHRLADVLTFYLERDRDPDRIYGRGADGQSRRFEDLPPVYQENLNREAPFRRDPAGRPALTATEVGDIIAFLQTLTDGYTVTQR